LKVGLSDTTDLLSPHSSDVQARRPATEVSLTRVGVRGVEKVIRVGGGTSGNGRPAAGDHYFAELECFVDLDPSQAGVHMSRFEEVVNEAIDSVVLGETLRAEELAAHIARTVLERQEGMRAEVTIAARYPETVPAPASKIPTQEIYTLLGTAVASPRGTRTLTGVEAQGMTACPCAQDLVAGRARERLQDDGFSEEEIARVFDAVPVATHNQRGIGSLRIGRPEDTELEVDARDLLHIVEQSMSSEIYELMKRSDEVSVVEKAHRRPRFVEDCVREMVRRVAERYPELRGGGFICARQENLETIHRHSVVAERTGLFDEVLAELETGERSGHHVTEREWLEAPCSASIARSPKK
jgi:GTP cyclohydrolase I/GTP cyclohydrolase-4